MQRRIRSYDFRNPDRFSKEDMRALEVVGNHFARLSVPILAAQLRLNVGFELYELAQSTFGYFVDTLPSHTLTAIFGLKPLAGRFLVTVDPELALVLLDLLLGGRGAKMRPRPLTDIELSLLRRFLQRLLPQLAEAISDQGEYETQLEALESNPLFAQILAPTDTVAVLRFVLRLEGNEGQMALALPHELVEPVLPRLVDRGRSIGDASSLWDLGDVPLELSCRLGTVELSLREFLALEEGDILTMNVRVGRPLELYAQGHPQFRGRVGAIGRELVFEVQERLERGE